MSSRVVHHRFQVPIVLLVVALSLAATSCTEPAPPVDLDPVLSWRAEDLGATEPEIVEQVESALELLRQAAASGAADEVLADRLGRVAMLHQIYQSRERALQAYDLASRIDRDEPRWPYYEALMLHENGELDGAVAALERCLATGTEVLAPRVRLAETLMSRGDVEAAAERFDELRAEHPESLRVAVSWAETRLELGRADEALRVLEDLHVRQPEERRILLALGRARRAAGDLEGARPLLEQVESLSAADRRLDLFDRWVQELAALDRSSEAAANRGRSLLAQGLPEAALKEIQIAVNREPERAAYWTDLGSAQAQLGRTKEAERSYEKALDIDPEYLPALARLGRLQQVAGRHHEAVGTFDRILALDPTRAAILLLKGESHRLLGQYLPAVESFERVLEANPGDERTLIGLVAAHVQRGDVPAAAKTVRRGVEARPGSYWFRSLDLRLCALGVSDDPACRVDLEAAEILFRGRPTVFSAETLAMAYAARGELRAASSWQEAAIQGLRAGSEDTRLARRRAVDYREGQLRFSPFEPSELGAAKTPCCRRPFGIAEGP